MASFGWVSAATNTINSPNSSAAAAVSTARHGWPAISSQHVGPGHGDTSEPITSPCAWNEPVTQVMLGDEMGATSTARSNWLAVEVIPRAIDIAPVPDEQAINR